MKSTLGRGLQFFLLMVFTIFCVVACGNNSLKTTTPLSSSLPASEYHLVNHAMGATKVPVSPQRIVTLDGSAIENVLALGGKPVGTVLNGSLDEQPAYLRESLADTKLLGSFEQPNLEKILALKPDLILGDKGISENIYPQLSQIAPTVLAEYNASDSWKEMLKLHAEALGKSKAAEQIIGKYYARLAQFKAQMGDRLRETDVSVVRIYPEAISLYQKGSFSGSILRDAGLSRPVSQRQENVQQQISKERVLDADGNVIFLWRYSDDYKGDTQNQQSISQSLKADPLWLKLQAVQQGKVYEVPDYWIGFGPLAADAIVDDLFKYLVNTP